MREVSYSDFFSKVNNANKEMFEEFLSQRERRVKYKERDSDEIKLLDELCIEKWQKALANGSIFKVGKRELNYHVTRIH